MKILTITLLIIICILLYLTFSYLADLLIAAIQKRRKNCRNVTQSQDADPLAGSSDCVTNKDLENEYR